MPRRNTETVEVQQGSVIWTPDQTTLYTSTRIVTSSIIREAARTVLSDTGSYQEILGADAYTQAALFAINLRDRVEEIRTRNQLSNFEMVLGENHTLNGFLRRHLVYPGG